MSEHPAERLEVRKTAKLFINGAFPRSESGRSYPVHGHEGQLLGNAAQASRKDVRDAVRFARGALDGWAARDAYNRGQILYRVAEMLEARTAELAELVGAAEGRSDDDARTVVAASVDRWVWYAGWTDKLAMVLGSANPVAGPYFNFTVPEPLGVVGVLAPQDDSILGLVSVLAPVLAAGSTAVVVASEQGPLPAIALTEVLATSDVPPGVVNVLTGRTAELAGVLAAHEDVDGLDLVGADPEQRADLAAHAADSVTRTWGTGATDWRAAPGLERLRAAVELKTVWHPVGT